MSDVTFWYSEMQAEIIRHSLLYPHHEAQPVHGAPGYWVAVDLKSRAALRFTSYDEGSSPPHWEDVENRGTYDADQVIFLQSPSGAKLEYRIGPDGHKGGEFDVNNRHLTLEQARQLEKVCFRNALPMPLIEGYPLRPNARASAWPKPAPGAPSA